MRNPDDPARSTWHSRRQFLQQAGAAGLAAVAAPWLGGGDPFHDWNSIHSEWDKGKMDGFYTTNGRTAMGYYMSADLPYYYSLISRFPPRDKKAALSDLTECFTFG
jgi:Phosphoesterase family